MADTFRHQDDEVAALLRRVAVLEEEREGREIAFAKARSDARREALLEAATYCRTVHVTTTVSDAEFCREGKATKELLALGLQQLAAEVKP